MLCTPATGDESALQYPLPDWIFGFHGQQSCEKLLKALATALNLKYSHTHSLRKLVELLGDVSETVPLPPEMIALLQPFAVETRYDFGDPLTERDRTAIQAMVAALREHVVARILELER